jgi:valine dehydrogenase (NAD+)
MTPESDGHEEIIEFVDPATGVHIIVAIHSTVLGPALGGVRLSTYSHASDPLAAAYADALRLSRAMTYKNALAGLDHGGGKAVIVADSAIVTPELLHAYGRLIESLEGRYVTAADVGMTVDYMDTIGEVCKWTTGRSPERGGVGDSAILTAVGVWEGMRAAATSIFGTEVLTGRTVGVVGAGKVGGRLIDLLTAAGARVVVTDPSHAALDAVLAKNPGITVAQDLDDLLSHDLDVQLTRAEFN